MVHIHPRPRAGGIAWLCGSPLVLALTLFLGLALGLLPDARAERKPYDIAPAPAWVLPLVPDLGAAAPAGQVSKGVHYLLGDTQVRVDAAERVTYRHVASRALDSSGVEAIANLELRFDPSYQRLTLHAVNVRRGAQVLAKLETATVRVLQREAELDALIFDGSKTASIVLDDVRVGDVVEYAYSIRGHNPVFGARHFGSFDLQWSVPVAHVHARLLWPLGRELRLTRLNDAPAAEVLDGATHREHRWSLRNVTGRQVEADAPEWFHPYQAIQWGEFADWQAVADWAVPLYRLPAVATPKVRSEIARIAAQHAAPAERLLAALRLVQREVRYLGVEIGAGSHAPSQPETVLARRFGDCKDKTLLTVAILRGLGIEAQPALVNTSRRRAIERWQPSPGAFNHVLVRARLDGQDYWLDPTRSPQQGGLAQVVQADYGPALVVKAQSAALVAMAGDTARLQRREMHVVLDASEGFDQPAHFTVKTTAWGAAADSLRSALVSQGTDQMQRLYANFYAKSYAGLEVAAPMERQDDAEANRLVVTEHYLIKSLWRRADAKHRLEVDIEVPDVMELMRQPHTLVRDAPLAVTHPTDLTSRTEVLLPGRWEGKDTRVRVDDPAFEFERKETWQGARLLLEDRFRTRAEHVAPTDVARYAANLGRAREGLSVMLYHALPVTGFAAEPAASAASADASPAPRDGLQVGLAAGMMLAFAGMLAGAFGWTHRWDPEPLPPHRRVLLRGIDGGLIVVAGLVLIVIYALLRSIGDTLPLVAQAWRSTSDVAALADVRWRASKPLQILLVDGLLLAGCGAWAWMFIRHRSGTPMAFVVLAAGGVIAVLVHTGAIAFALGGPTAPSAGSWRRVLISSLIAVIAIVYMLRSPRVRATFVKRRVPAPGPSAPASLGLTAQA